MRKSIFHDFPRNGNKGFQSIGTAQYEKLVSPYYYVRGELLSNWRIKIVNVVGLANWHNVGIYLWLGLAITSCFLYSLGCSFSIFNILIKTATCEAGPNITDLSESLSVAQTNEESLVEIPVEDKPLMDRDFGCFIMISIYVFILLISIDERDFIDYDF